MLLIHNYSKLSNNGGVLLWRIATKSLETAFPDSAVGRRSVYSRFSDRHTSRARHQLETHLQAVSLIQMEMQISDDALRADNEPIPHSRTHTDKPTHRWAFMLSQNCFQTVFFFLFYRRKNLKTGRFCKCVSVGVFLKGPSGTLPGREQIYSPASRYISLCICIHAHRRAIKSEGLDLNPLWCTGYIFCSTSVKAAEAKDFLTRVSSRLNWKAEVRSTETAEKATFRFFPHSTSQLRRVLSTSCCLPHHWLCLCVSASYLYFETASHRVR